MSKRVMKPEAMQTRLDAKLGKGNYTLVGEYKGFDALTKVKHKCGRIEEYRWKNLIKGVSKCRCEQQHVNKRDLEYHNEELLKWGRKNFVCVEYNGARKTLNKYKHLVCGKIYKSSLDAIRQAKHCPHCHGKDGSGLYKVGIKEAQEKLNELFNNEYTILKYGANTKDKATVKHEPCGTIYKPVLAGLLYSDSNQCPECMLVKGLWTRKTVEFEGISFKLQGYEKHTLKNLVALYKAKNIYPALSDNSKRFNYYFNNKRCRYSPDFYIPKYNLVVETKSLMTLGLCNYTTEPFMNREELFERTKAKALEVIKQGFKFQLDVFNSNRDLVKLPSNWTLLSRKEVIAYINKPKSRFQFYLALSK